MKKKKFFIILASIFFLIVIANIFAPNAFEQLLNANNQKEHLSALRGFKEKVKINNIEECDNSCESKLFFTRNSLLIKFIVCFNLFLK